MIFKSILETNKCLFFCVKNNLKREIKGSITNDAIDLILQKFHNKIEIYI